MKKLIAMLVLVGFTSVLTVAQISAPKTTSAPQDQGKDKDKGEHKGEHKHRHHHHDKDHDKDHKGGDRK